MIVNASVLDVDYKELLQGCAGYIEDEKRDVMYNWLFVWPPALIGKQMNWLRESVFFCLHGMQLSTQNTVPSILIA
jgi:hypothetical protein